jgi:hypothetical protein
MKIYIAGPMRGIPGYNFPAFDAAAVKFREAGWEVVNPADLNRAVVTDNPDLLPPNFFTDALRRDLNVIFDCEAIGLLGGWQWSESATLVYQLAQVLKKSILDVDTMAQYK